MQNKTYVLRECGIYLLIFLLVFFIVPRFVMEKILIDGISMENSLFDGEHVLIEKVSRYFDGPDRFEVVVFHKQSGGIKKTYVKRVIGLPGETVQIKGSTIFINEEPLLEDFGKDPIQHSGIAEQPVTLKKGEYFVLGDNRTVSLDSRDARVGIVKKAELDGVVFFRIYPLGELGGIK